MGTQLLQYPSNLANSVFSSQLNSDSVDGYYGHWILISIYSPEKTSTTIGESDAGNIVGRSALTVGTPFLLNLLGFGPGSIAVGSVAGAGIGAFGNLDKQQTDIALTSETKLLSDNPGIDPASTSKILSARKEGRIPETRLSLGLGVKYEKQDISIALPMPKQISSNYGFEYSDSDFSSMRVINAGIAFAKSKTNGAGGDGGMQLDSPEVQGLLNFIETIPAAAIDQSFKIFGLDPNSLDYMRAGKNQVKIPYSEKLFKSVKRRSFEIEYKLMPKSRKEVSDLYDIIKTLKKYAHPSKSNSSYYYTTPAEFIVDFQFFGERNMFLPKFGRLAIDSIDVNYGSSDGYSTLRPINKFNFSANEEGDSNTLISPNEINLKISFTELELLTQERIEEGY